MTPVNPDTLDALTTGIQSEVASYVFYLEAAKKAKNNQHKEILERLAAEEKDHYFILEREYDSLVRSEKWISLSDILKQEGLPKISEEMTLRHQDLVDEVSKALDMISILEIAYGLEEEAYTLFSNSIDKCESDEGKAIFEKLAKFEQGHMDIISDMMKEYE